MSATPFYVTTPIYYVNDRPHLGHVYTTMVADVVARYHRLRGDDTFFLTGVDEHAAKVADKAVEHGLSAQQWADRNAGEFRKTFEKLRLTHDDFVRTSSDHHKQKVTGYVQRLLDSGDVYAGEYEGWYDAGQEEYVPEAKARANDYKSDVNGKPLVKKAEKNYFFKLSKYQPTLIDLLETGNPQFVQPDARKNEVLGRLRDGINDVPISRTGSGGWGIPVPGDLEQTIYVWIDALFNYYSYVDTDDRKKYWPANVHFIAKDILWFHAVIWPALLLALGEKPPHRVYAHSYWVSDTGAKMSKSLGNFLDPEAIDNYVAEFGLDALRYFLATRGPLQAADSTFSPELFAEVYNADLANTFGNSCSRVTNMIGKYFDGKAPEKGPHVGSSEKYGDFAKEALAKYTQAFERYQLEKAADAALSLVRGVDNYIEETQPFKLAKDPEKLPEVGTVLYHCAEALRIASVLLWPFCPDKCSMFWQRIGFGRYADAVADRGTGDLEAWTKWGQLQPGTPIEKGEALFPRWQPPKQGE